MREANAAQERRRKLQEQQSEEARRQELAQRNREREERIKKHIDSVLVTLELKEADVYGRELVEDLELKKSAREQYRPNNDLYDSSQSYDYDQQWVIWTSKKGYRIRVYKGHNRYGGSEGLGRDFKDQVVEEVALPQGLARRP